MSEYFPTCILRSGAIGQLQPCGKIQGEGNEEARLVCMPAAAKALKAKLCWRKRRRPIACVVELPIAVELF
jgi:hypothetical protein